MFANDKDLDLLSREELIGEVKKLRDAIRKHRDSTGHELCWHHPILWSLLPEKTPGEITVPEWSEFMEGCIRYRRSLDEQLPGAARTGAAFVNQNAVPGVSGNPIIKHKYTSDPTVVVYNDKVYLYTGHDEAGPDQEEYIMNKWLCFSSADLKNWEEHPSPLKAVDFKWASGGAFASKVIERAGKFYWYVSVKHAEIKGTAIGVAISSHPERGYTDALGAALITSKDVPPTDNEKANLDPSVLIDDDGTAYIFWGNGKCYYARLGDDLISIDSEIKQVDLPGFEEGSHIHKRNDWYYLSYGYGMPEKVAYAMSRSIHGPWEFKGILNEIAGNCLTNRPCIIDIKGKSFIFYHNGGLTNGGSHRRSVCLDGLFYNSDNTIKRIIMTSEGTAL
ncbi:glycoside hydrolase family 43 protein [Desertivirga xinjiangensis]|uniref:glycoside hydrolase family 43 protein n=1 Tax=Desertivirga xinjiangensis TaxID=539206 RepID=UPI00210CD24D|nr:glycoside hydrolase family 43 protein [Pedobacter xinjiangensis]